MKIKKQKKQKVEGYIVQSKPRKMGMNKKAGMLGMLGNVARNLPSSLEEPKGGRMIKSGTDDYAKFYKIINDKYMSQEEKDLMLDELIGSGKKFEDLMIGAGIVKPGFFTGDYMSKLKRGEGIFESKPFANMDDYDFEMNTMPALEEAPKPVANRDRPKTLAIKDIPESKPDFSRIKSKFEEFDNYSKYAPRGPILDIKAPKYDMFSEPNLKWQDGLESWEMEPRGKRAKDMSYPNDTGRRPKTKAERKAAKTLRVSKAKNKIPPIRKIQDIELKNINDSKFTPPPAEKPPRPFVDESKPRTSRAAEENVEMKDMKPKMEQMEIYDPTETRKRILQAENEDPATVERKRKLREKILNQRADIADAIRKRDRINGILKEVRSGVNDVQQITAENMVAALQREGNLANMEAKSNNLLEQSKQYKRLAERFNGRQKIPWKKLALFGGIGAAALGANKAIQYAFSKNKKNIPASNITPSKPIPPGPTPTPPTPIPIPPRPKPTPPTPTPTPAILPPTRSRYVERGPRRRY